MIVGVASGLLYLPTPLTDRKDIFYTIIDKVGTDGIKSIVSSLFFDGRFEYYLADWTKDERGESRGGRKYPLTSEIRALFNELRDVQGEKGIKSDYIFCKAPSPGRKKG